MVVEVVGEMTIRIIMMMVVLAIGVMVVVVWMMMKAEPCIHCDNYGEGEVVLKVG